MTQMTDMPPHLMVAGILPLPPDTSLIPPDITSPQGRDQFYIEDLMRRANMSIPLGKFPTKDSVSAAVQKVHQNLDMYTANVRSAYYKLRTGSEEKLENFIDSLITQGHSTRFDLTYSNFWSYNQAMMFIGGLLFGILTIVVSTIAVLVMILKKILLGFFGSLIKEKTN